MIKLALIDNGIPYHMRNNRNQRIVHKSFLASKCDPSEYKDDIYKFSGIDEGNIPRL